METGISIAQTPFQAWLDKNIKGFWAYLLMFFTLGLVSTTTAYQKISERWGATSRFQVFVIFVVFAITGSTSVYVRKFIFSWIGITPETAWYIKVPMYVLVIFPTYQALFLTYGFLLGQFKFAWAFEKKMLNSLIGRRKKKEQTSNEKGA